MRRKSFGNMHCPIARSLERVGEWWTILILRDALCGLTRFDQFEESLGIAPNILTRRLRVLVEAGLLERHRYKQRPPRDEYLLTQAGRDFRSVLQAFHAWGNKHLASEEIDVVIGDAQTAADADPILVNRKPGPSPCHRTVDDQKSKQEFLQRFSEEGCYDGCDPRLDP